MVAFELLFCSAGCRYYYVPPITAGASTSPLLMLAATRGKLLELLVTMGIADVVKLALQERRSLYGQRLEIVIVNGQLKTMQYAAYQWSDCILEAAK